MFEFTENVKALEVAKKWMLDNPDFEPKFSRVFNVLLNDNEETRLMTQQVLNEAQVDRDSPAFSFNQYVTDVVDHKKEINHEEL